jgi:alkylhydroperoxidase family enzyme
MALSARVKAPSRRTGDLLRDSALGLVPETLEPYARLNRLLWFEGPLGPAELEVARLYNARHVNCVVCRSVRYDIARADGLDESLVAQIDRDFANSDLCRRHKLILTLTDHYLNDPRQLSQEHKQQLLQEFTPQQLAHLCMAIVLFNAFSRCAVSLGGMPEEVPLMEISVPQ